MGELRWLRLWTDVVDDPKLLLLAPSDRWHYVAILALKRSGMLDDTDDSAEMLDRKVGLRLRLDDRERDETRRRLMEVRLIDSNWQPAGWEGRQFASDQDSTAAERQRRHRENQRHALVTRDSRDSVTGVSPGQIQSRDRADTEGEGKRAAARPVARRLPDGFELTPERRAYAEREGINPQREFEKFCDHWRSASGANARKHDWDAAWRNWCRKAADDLKRSTPRAAFGARPEAPKPKECKHGLTGVCIYCRRESQAQVSGPRRVLG